MYLVDEIERYESGGKKKNQMKHNYNSNFPNMFHPADKKKEKWQPCLKQNQSPEVLDHKIDARADEASRLD